MKTTIPIWVVTITHKHGHDTYVAGTEREAFYALDQYATEWWDVEVGRQVQKPKTIGKRIEMYFSHTGETFEVLAHQVKITVPRPVTVNGNTRPSTPL